LDVLSHIGVGEIDSVIADPPYGVELKERVTKHSRRSASSLYMDDSAWVENQIIPRVMAWVGTAKRAAITPGIRMLQRYPNAADIGGVFQPNGAGCGPWGFTCFHPVLFYGKCPYLATRRGSRPTAVRATNWVSADVDHPCPKPVEFMQWMVERASNAGEMVADPFMGSGTTGIACIKTGRNFIGIEKSPEYFDIACRRIEKAVADVGLMAPAI
jgi:hypothetical protein